jgi:hypothetical protein
MTLMLKTMAGMVSCLIACFSLAAYLTVYKGSMMNSLGTCVGTLGSIPCCVVCPNPYKSVRQGNVGLVTKFGRFARAVDPGLVKVNPLSENLIQIDVKIQIVGMWYLCYQVTVGI